MCLLWHFLKCEHPLELSSNCSFRKRSLSKNKVKSWIWNEFHNNLIKFHHASKIDFTMNWIEFIKSPMTKVYYSYSCHTNGSSWVIILISYCSCSRFIMAERHFRLVSETTSPIAMIYCMGLWLDVTQDLKYFGTHTITKLGFRVQKLLR